MRRLLLSLLLVAGSAQADTLGLHTFSLHVPSKSTQNNDNFGVFYRWDSGMMLGGYHNTKYRPSFYAARMFDVGPVDLTLGAVTGYADHPLPLVTLSKGLPLGVRPVIGFGKNAKPVFHLTLEYHL